jgi:hypothetical protein
MGRNWRGVKSPARSSGSLSRSRKAVVAVVALAGAAVAYSNTACQLITLAATRDPAKLYQNGQPVADVVGSVEEHQRVVFHQLANVEHLAVGASFEYGRRKLRVVDVGSIAARDYTLSPDGWEVLDNVLRDVVCEVVGD